MDNVKDVMMGYSPFNIFATVDIKAENIIFELKESEIMINDRLQLEIKETGGIAHDVVSVPVIRNAVGRAIAKLQPHVQDFLTGKIDRNKDEPIEIENEDHREGSIRVSMGFCTDPVDDSGRLEAVISGYVAYCGADIDGMSIFEFDLLLEDNKVTIVTELEILENKLRPFLEVTTAAYYETFK
ncbi:hypothetical protein QTG56_25860 (plasmid) [Rossellomorea sp. AcN35-11]|nr:hypothetical protein [Rossellomorea aquimaris]WJV32043.1 hypothetical protein QTG56_25860 [Rossellomorea sp. AcN35-11]